MIPAHSAAQAELGHPVTMGADGYCYRRTPEGQPTVADLLRPGMQVRTNYCNDQAPNYVVVDVSGPWDYYPDRHPHQQNVPIEGESPACPHYSLTVQLNPEAKRGRNHGWLNELVAVDGRILKLFEANADEVFIVNAQPQGQLSLF